MHAFLNIIQMKKRLRRRSGVGYDSVLGEQISSALDLPVGSKPTPVTPGRLQPSHALDDLLLVIPLFARPEALARGGTDELSTRGREEEVHLLLHLGKGEAM